MHKKLQSFNHQAKHFIAPNYIFKQTSPEFSMGKNNFYNLLYMYVTWKKRRLLPYMDVTKTYMAA